MKHSKFEVMMLAIILMCNEMIEYGLRNPKSDIAKMMGIDI